MASKTPPTVDLLDMLLLGGPGGKTELIEGSVRRVFVAPNEEDAKHVFLELAHQLHDFYRAEWNEEASRSTKPVALGRMRLSLAGNLVELEVKMSPAIWRAFAEGR
ncbi:MAG: hypothetical protein QM765_01395 [Myxococcales bacterium]